jgi:hypothetical protein
MESRTSEVGEEMSMTELKVPAPKHMGPADQGTGDRNMIFGIFGAENDVGRGEARMTSANDGVARSDAIARAEDEIFEANETVQNLRQRISDLQADLDAARDVLTKALSALMDVVYEDYCKERVLRAEQSTACR